MAIDITINALAMSTEEFITYRNSYITQQYVVHGKHPVNKFIKAVDKKLGLSTIVEYRKGQKVVVFENGNLNLYAYSRDTDRFIFLVSEPIPFGFRLFPDKRKE